MITKKIFFLFFVLILFRCSNEGYNKLEQERFITKLDSLILLIRRGEIKNEIEIKDLIESKWEKVYFFPAYTSRREINREIGFEWNNSVVKKIENYDDNDLVVFIENNKVVLYVFIPRKNIIFETSNNSDKLLGLTPDNAKFEIEFSTYKNHLKLSDQDTIH